MIILKTKYRIFFCVLCALTAIALTSSTIYSSKNKTDSDTDTVGFMYTICEYNGNVAVFVYGENEPKVILDCKINSLPELDAANIRHGINIRTDDELQYFIEAFD